MPENNRNYLHGLPFPVPTNVYWFFRGQYDGRPYHNFEHIDETILRYREVSKVIVDKTEVALAILFHDIVYDALAKDNEVKSAELAVECIPKLFPGVPVNLDKVQALILLTAKHGNVNRYELGVDEKLFLDCDMAILGANPDRFLEYDNAIALEYSAVPKDLYSSGRRKFFLKLLESESIFLSYYFQASLESKARLNIVCALTGEYEKCIQALK